MKKFSTLNESSNNPGNDLLKTGVSNHYTPIEALLVNINNLYCNRMSITAERGEDNVSIRLSSSRFIRPDKTLQILNTILDDYYNSPSLYQYIINNGLTKYTCVDLGGGYCVAYFSPEDIKTAQDPSEMETNKAYNCGDCCNSEPCDSCDCCPSCESFEEEIIDNIILEDDDEEEMIDATLEKIIEILKGPDKVKAAKKLELLVSNEINLPRDFYFAAVKFKTGEECVALRWKYETKMPFGLNNDKNDHTFRDKLINHTRSIMHIFSDGERGIWVQDFAKDSIIQLPKEVKTLIHNVLELLNAEETSNPSVFGISVKRKERKDKDNDKDKDKEEEKNKKDDKKDVDNKDKSQDHDEDVETDQDRGDNDDDLLK